MKSKKGNLKNNKKGLRLSIKLIFCFIYLIVMLILSYSAYRLYQKDKKIVSWDEVQDTSEYSYLDISKMSEAFAKTDNGKKQIHFVIEQDANGLWHSYIIEIKKSDYKKYKSLIDYSYEKTDKSPKKVRVYGYPKLITKNIKKLAIKYSTSFFPAENEVKLTNKNFTKYVTNTYLDTTEKQKESINIIVSILGFLVFLLIVLFIMTIFDKDKIVDEVDKIMEEEEEKTKKKASPKNKSKKKKKKSKKEEDIEII